MLVHGLNNCIWNGDLNYAVRFCIKLVKKEND